jgi:fucose 4-O-acetylase-like acetyltransferase
MSFFKRYTEGVSSRSREIYFPYFYFVLLKMIFQSCS